MTRKHPSYNQIFSFKILMFDMQILFWIGIVILGFILFACIIGIRRAKRDSYSSFEVACAGSTDNSYPDKVSIKVPKSLINTNNQRTPYVVKGNSMQYANINTEDIIFVTKASPNNINNTLPKVTLLSFSPAKEGGASHKIRRTWKIEDASIDDDRFRHTMQTILACPLFGQLRNDLQDKCPSDEILMQGAIESLQKFRQIQINNHLPITGDSKILISTTYRTEKDRLEFSIHSSDTLQGIVTSVMRRKRCQGVE